MDDNHYYPFGLTLSSTVTSSTAPAQPYKYQAIELERNFGLEQYETFFRGLDPQLGRFNSIDPKAESDYSMSPFSSMRNNPALYTDPRGDVASTDVRDNKDGTFTVVGGQLNSDRNIYVVQPNEQGGYSRTGQTIGKSLTEYSFFNDQGKPVIGAVIDPLDLSGRNFLNNEITGPNIGLLSYVNNAKGGEPLDFKGRGIDERSPAMSEIQHRYRGILFEGVNGFGNQDGAEKTFASARDIGNVAAGWVAGKSGLSWGEARLGFDALESKQKGRFTTERMTTQRAEWLGYKIGNLKWEQRYAKPAEAWIKLRQ